ncbi:MAG TPA: cation-transporting P-type ATPase [Candidatus Saccharimonadales bacterium]|nr:cation-transporting P-type ATPase [Candidatus Saccharimonadales bacterium]
MDGHKLPYYRQSPEAALEELRSQTDGLQAAEAAERLRHMGKNQLERSKRVPVWLIFIRQFKDLLVLILLLSAGFSLYLHDVKTAVILALIATMNASVGFFQEHKAESLLASLERLVVPQAKVLRGGKVQEIASSELVPGDVIYIEAGDSVPADARVLQEDELATNDFALTGESQPTRKFRHAISAEVPLSSRHNMLFMGTTVALGNGHALVVGTGMNTELGRIAGLAGAAHTDASPLQKEMNNLAVRLTQATLVLAAALTLIELRSDIGFKTALLFAISIAAAMIPNGLIAEVNITLAQTAARMAKARALVKKLSAVETLGATNIIATDKTGTLTKNEMTVTQVLVGKTEYQVSGTGYETNGAICTDKGRPISGKALKDLHLFFETGALASNAEVNPPDDEHAVWYVVGDPTEGALITLSRKAGLDPAHLNERFPERKEYAFDSARKRMTSVREVDGQLYAFVKGAPESILACSSDIWDHGHTRPLSRGDRTFFEQYSERHAAAAERNLAFAYRVLPKGFDPAKHHLEDAEQDLIFLGIVSMVDPLRDEVPAAMAAAQNAHIKVSVITGDAPTTARAIAEKAGLGMQPGGTKADVTVLTGSELAALPDAQVLELVLRGGAVFSRVSPEDKLRIVEIAKSSHRVVAVTGDGINDAPALKRADIGVAMGRTGTDVAKQAAEIVLLDDSFSTLVTAVEQGRLTFHNIKKAARCALTDNASELVLVLISLAATAVWGIPAAITAIQILAVDIVAEMFPITALGWDPAAKRFMREGPRRLDDHIINRTTVFEFVAYGLLAACLAYANYLFFFARNHISAVHVGTAVGPYLEASTLTYVTIVLCQFMNLLLVRSQGQPFIGPYLWSNKKLLSAFAISLFLIMNIVYNPLVQPYFGAHGLTLTDWLCAVGAAGIYTLTRLFHRHTKATSHKELIRKHGPEKVRSHLQKAV